MKTLLFSLLLASGFFINISSIYATTTQDTSGAGGNRPGSLSEEWFNTTGSNNPANRPTSIRDGETGEIKYLGPDGGYYLPGTRVEDATGKLFIVGTNGILIEADAAGNVTTNRIGVGPNGNITTTPITPTTSAAPVPTPTNIPLLDQIIPVSTFGSGQPLHNILNQLFYIGLVLAVILAIVMIIRGGLEYMTIDAISSKENGKSRVKAALGGLLLAFSAILILNTINPGLTSLNIVLSPLMPIQPGVSVGVPSGVSSGITSGTRTGTDANGNPIYVPSTPSGEGAINPVATAYSPQGGGSTMEGGYPSSKPGLDGQSLVRTLDDYANGSSPYLTLAGDPDLFGQSYIIPQITYTNSSGQSVTLNNVRGYVHDTGSAFTGQGTSRIDIPVGRDYASSVLNSQPFSHQNIEFIPVR